MEGKINPRRINSISSSARRGKLMEDSISKPGMSTDEDWVRNLISRLIRHGNLSNRAVLVD